MLCVHTSLCDICVGLCALCRNLHTLCHNLHTLCCNRTSYVVIFMLYVVIFMVYVVIFLLYVVIFMPDVVIFMPYVMIVMLFGSVHQTRSWPFGNPLQLLLLYSSGRHYDYYASAAHRELALSTLTTRRKLPTAKMVFKCLTSNPPPYPSQLFSCPSHYNTHFSLSSQLNLPPLHTSLGQRSFSFVSAPVSRLLPAHVRGATDFKHFSTLCTQVFSY